LEWGGPEARGSSVLISLKNIGFMLKEDPALLKINGPFIAISATFTAEPLRDPLSFWLDRLGFNDQIEFAPYNQVFQQLLDPASLLACNRGGVNIVLVRLEDWGRFQNGATPEILEKEVHHLVDCLRSSAASLPSPLLVVICPSSPAFLARPGHADFVARMEQHIRTQLGGLQTVYFLEHRELEELYPLAEPYDPHSDELGHVPYKPEYFAALATFLARKIHALRMTPYKVIALDCDDTLWRGICGEDGPLGVVIDPPRHFLQQFMLAQHQAGMLLCLCSKNNMEDVLETFRAHPEMPLSLEHFVALRINWTAKSANLASLAEELQLGLDSFIFIDDNAQECGEVQARRPEVLTLQLPEASEEIPDFLRHVWAFDRLRITEEDTRRTALYRQQIERSRLEKQAKTLEEFIASLKLEVRITPLKPEGLTRAAQLTQRTNQMNFTTIRRSEADLQHLMAGGAECLAVDVSDRFGSYGFTGLAIFSTEGEALKVDTFLLSCRVLGRGVEHRLLARLGEIAAERGLTRVDVPFIPTARNHPALMFLESVGSRFKTSTEAGFLFSFPTAYACEIKYKPAAAPPATLERIPQPETQAREPVDYAYIATRLRSVEQILQQMHGVRPAQPAPQRQEAPRTDLERQLAELWAELLRVPSVGIHDNFFDLGGHSLLAVELLSRVRQKFNVDLSLDLVYASAFTVAELAKAIELQMIEQAGPEQYAEILAELEKLSDEEARALLERELQSPAGEKSG